MTRKSVQARRKAQERKNRWTVYIGILLLIIVIYPFTILNYISQYIEIYEFKQNGILVTARIIAAENYKRHHGTKYTAFEPGGYQDLTLEFELGGKMYRETYQYVDIYSSEANKDWYSHINVYVLPDASDIQTQRVVEKCMELSYFEFGTYPGTLFLLWIAGICFWEIKIVGKS